MPRTKGLFFVGDVVEWTSQSAGIAKTKRGIVEAVILSGTRPHYYGMGMQRDHDSYIVRVREGSRSKAYWPRVNHLRLIEAVF